MPLQDFLNLLERYTGATRCMTGTRSAVKLPSEYSPTTFDRSRTIRSEHQNRAARLMAGPAVRHRSGQSISLESHFRNTEATGVHRARLSGPRNMIESCDSPGLR